MNKYGSRKFIIAVLLILAVLFLSYNAMHLVPVAQVVGVIPSVLGFAGLVLGAIGVMYPATNAFVLSKWSNGDE